MLCSLVSWGSAFTAGAGKQNIPPGKRQMAPNPSNEQQEYFITAFCEHVRPCTEDYKRGSLQRDARPAKYEKF
ncbi:hypothetical protein ACROYT_G011162 [Oculina patagonica]